MILAHCLKCRKPLGACHSEDVFCSDTCEQDYYATIKSEVPPVSTRLSFGVMVCAIAAVALTLLAVVGKNDLDSEQRTSLETRRAEKLAAR